MAVEGEGTVLSRDNLIVNAACLGGGRVMVARRLADPDLEGRKAIPTAVTAIHDPHKPHSLLAGDLNGQPGIGLCLGVAQIRYYG